MLAYEWDGVRRGRAGRWSGQGAQGHGRRLRATRPRRRDDRGDLPAGGRRGDADDRDDQAQGREGDHRLGAEGTQEAGRVGGERARRPPCASCCSPARAGSARPPPPPAPPCSAPPPAADAGAVDRRRALARRRVRRAVGATRSRSRTACASSRSTRSARFERSWAEVQRYLLACSTRRGRPRRGRGAHRAARRRGGARPARAAHAGRLRPLGRGGRRLRPDRRDAAAAGAARGARLVRRPGLPGQRRVVRALRPVLSRAAGVPMPADTCSTLSSGCTASSRTCAGCSPARRVGAAGAHARAGGPGRGPACLTTLSLYGYRSTAWSPTGSSRRRRRRLAGRLGARAGRGAGARWTSPSPRCRSGGSALPARRAGRCRRARAVAAELYGGDDPLARHTARSRFRSSGHAGGVVRLCAAARRPLGVDLARHGDDLVVTVGSSGG